MSFNPVWPGHHAALWNLLLALLALALIVYVYRRDGRSRPARILLGRLARPAGRVRAGAAESPGADQFATRAPNLPCWRC